MSWRTVVISRRCKLDLKMNYMEIRNDEGTNRLFLDEISTVIVETTAVSITGCLIAELAKKKIKLIFCDEKRNPCCEAVSYYGSHDCSRKIENQINWNYDTKQIIWSEIVCEKIRNQAKLLKECKMENEYMHLMDYVSQVEPGDVTNREGHASKVYFNALFGKDFTRTADNVTNAALNYGYSIILSSFNREIVSAGYLTQLGLFHKNMFNQFNLSCDLMEPFRILVDRAVRQNNFAEFDKEAKYSMVDILNESVIIDSTVQYVSNAIKIYCRSVFDSLDENDISLIKFFDYEL